jgi:hypothetical protein
MFWEYTPASTLTLQPSSLPTSVQPFVNPRLLQRIMWVFPKVRDLSFWVLDEIFAIFICYIFSGDSVFISCRFVDHSEYCRIQLTFTFRHALPASVVYCKSFLTWKSTVMPIICSSTTFSVRGHPNAKGK